MSQHHFMVNGRPVVHQKSKGFAQAQSINYTGEAKTPIPYTVRAEARDLDNLCKGLMVNGNPCATIESFVSRCTGDEAGDGGGIFSGSIGGRCDFLTASPDSLVSDAGLLVDGQPLVREGDLIILNQRNSAVTAWQQENGKQMTAEPPGEFAASALPTPHVIDVALMGACPGYSQHYLAIREKNGLKPKQWLSCGQHSEDANAYWRRLCFKDLPPEDQHLMLYLPSENGQSISIPFPAKAQPTTTMQADKPDYHQQENCLIPVKICQHFVPDDCKIEPVQGDFSEILSLDEDLRWQIYSRLVHHGLSQQDKTLENTETKQSQFFKLGQLLAVEGDSEPPKAIKDFEGSWLSYAGPRLATAIEQQFRAKKRQSKMRQGFLYIFLNGTLWRELLLDGKGMAREIDLSKELGKDLRASAGLADPLVYLPWRMAGEAFDIELAFSEVQWSWARVNYFGGVDVADLRFQGKNVRPTTVSASEGECRRKARFLKLDLSSFVQEKPADSVHSDHQIIHSLCQDEQIPIIYLSDPLAPIEQGLKDIDYLMERLEELAQAIQLEPHFLTAITCYRYFFDERFAHNQAYNEAEKARQRRQISAELYKDYKRYSADYLKNRAKMEFPEQPWEDLNKDQVFDQYYALSMNEQGEGELAKRIREGKPNELKEQQGYLDEVKIKGLLKVKLRQRIREMIRLIQQTVVSLLEASEEGFAVTGLSPQLKTLSRVKTEEVLRDYFSLGPYQYEKAFSALAGLTTWITMEPAQVDRDLDTSNDFDHRKATPGQRFIQSLLKKDHPLHAMIFADEQAISEAKSVDKQSHPDAVENDGRGDFSGARYAFSWRCLESLSMDKILNKSSDLIHQVVSAFAMNVHHAVAYADESTVKSAHALIYQLLQASDHDLMTAVSLTHSMDILQKEHLIIGLKPQQSRSASRAGQATDMKDWRSRSRSNHSSFNVTVNQGSETMVTQSLKPKGNQAIIDALQAQDELKAYWQHAPEGIAVRTHYQMKTTPPVYILKTKAASIPKSSSLDRILEQGTAVLKENAANIDRVATSILSVLAVMNLHTVGVAFFEKSKNGHLSKLDKLELIYSIAELIYSIEAFSVSLMKLDDVSKLYAQNQVMQGALKSGLRASFLLTPLSAIGAVGYVFSLSSHLFQLICLFNEHDYSGAFSRSLLTLVNLGSLFSILGTAVSRSLKGQAMELAETAGLAMTEASEQVLLRFLAQQGVRFRMLRFLLPFSNTGAGVLLIASGFILEILYEWCRDKPLTHWVKNCSFSRYALTQRARNYTDFDQVLSLSELLFKPEAQLQFLPLSKKGRRLACLSIEFPVFMIGKHQLSVRTCLMKKKYLISGVSNSSHLMAHAQEAELFPSQINYVFHGENALKKIELYYEVNEEEIRGEKAEQLPMGVILSDYDIQSFFRLHLEDEMVLPTIEKDHHYIKASDYPQDALDDKSWYLSPALLMNELER